MDSMGIVMAVVGLGITVLVLGIMGFVFYRVFGGLAKNKAERQRLLTQGIPARGRILNVQMGGMTMTVGVQRHLQLVIQAEIQPNGGAPYQATLTEMISELQVPQVQPGASIAVRVDPTNPMKMALESVGAPGAQPAQGYAAPGGAYGQAPGGGYAQAGGQPGYGAPGGYAAPQMQAVAGVPKMPKGAKIGLVIGIIGALVGVGVGVVVVLVNVLGVGLGDATAGDSVCARAARCCEAIGGPPDACKNHAKMGVPDSACEMALDGYERAAKAQGKTCQ